MAASALITSAGSGNDEENACEVPSSHARLTELAETGNLPGAYLAGHRQVTTINRYAKPNRKAAERAIEASEERRRASAPEPAPSTLRSGVHSARPTERAPAPASSPKALPPDWAQKAAASLVRLAQVAKSLPAPTPARRRPKKRQSAAARRALRARCRAALFRRLSTPRCSGVGSWCEGEDLNLNRASRSSAKTALFAIGPVTP